MNIIVNTYYFNNPCYYGTLKRYLKPNMKVVIIPFAHEVKYFTQERAFDELYHPEYGRDFKTLSRSFYDYGIEKEDVYVLNPHRDLSRYMKCKIEKSDILNNFKHKKDIFIVGNKNDIKSNNLDFSTIEQYCQMNNLNLAEISVKTNIGIPKLMQLLDNCLLTKEWYKTFVYSSHQKFALF
jgi:hypothetical protein